MSEDKLNKKLFDKISSKIEKGLAKDDDGPHLLEVSKLTDFEDNDISTILQAFYKSGDSVYIHIGSILNSIFTHGYNVFVLTKKYAEDLIRADENNGVKSISGQTFKKIMKTMYQDHIIVCLRKPIKNDLGVSGMSGLFELVDMDYLLALSNSIGANTLEAQRDKFTEWFDANNPQYEEEKPLTTEEHAMIAAAKAKVEEKRRQRGET